MQYIYSAVLYFNFKVWETHLQKCKFLTVFLPAVCIYLRSALLSHLDKQESCVQFMVSSLENKHTDMSTIVSYFLVISV